MVLNNRKRLKILGTRGPILWTAGRSKLGLRCAFRTVPGLPGWRWMRLPSLGMPLPGGSKEVILPI